MRSAAYIRLIEAIQGVGNSVIDGGDKAQAQCPAHDDRQASLSLKGIEGQALVYCHAGCETSDVVGALNLTMADLFDKPRDGATYDYSDGRTVRRTPEKKFWQSGNTKGRALYRVERVADVAHVVVAEGEKDVHALESVGATAVCSAMGAGKADRFDWSPLAGKQVTIVADRDEPGRKHAQQVAGQLAGIATSINVVQAKIGKDAADHIAAGLSIDELVPIDSTAEEISSPGNGAELLDAVQSFLSRFVAYPSTHALVAHVLWIVHCWLMDAWESTPRIAFLSPEPGSGKSRALEVTEPLVPRPVHAVNTTPAYLFRKVADEAGRPTILYDEIDTVFGPKAKDNEDIRGMLNAGHRKGATAGRCVMRGKVVETEELEAYCAVALAGLDDLPDTIMTRAVVIRMRRRAPGEHVEPWRLRVNGPDAEQLRNRIASWAGSVVEQLAGDFWPELPEQVVDRDADVWEALIAVADLAGGEWPQRARGAAVALVAASKQRAPSVGVLLLRDIRAVFTGSDEKPLDVDNLSTEQLLSELNRMEESPWSTIRRGEPLDSRGLSQRLSKYGIGSKLHAGERGVRGYTKAQFTDAWSRYLPPVAATSAPPAPQLAAPGAHVADVADPQAQAGDNPALSMLLNPVRVEGKDRCPECSFHTPTQGHREKCSAGAA